MDIKFVEEKLKEAEQHMNDLQREIIATNGAIRAFQMIVGKAEKEGVNK
jgi:hypothetical protein